MREILKALNRSVGINGSMIVTTDGVVVASDLGGHLHEERVAAVASLLIRSLRRSLEQANIGPLHRCVLTASQGKLVLVEAGSTFLIVATDAAIRLDVTLLDIEAAARRIAAHAQLQPAEPSHEGFPT